ncbi:DUF4391 domain-containing protein [Neolewinella antarctica]|uniref:DUF4391 domain-containing protein n=1 Tax=Neolewinella antarctica TaxID=442734 RepID=A0ABX0XCU7_9BACT|nr:DUF4391 domain-containing protein [Neolewinella antarctica]NJC27037.1 hypothetical protein [Neolewinella antarctica]
MKNLFQLPHPAQKQTPFPKSFFTKNNYPLTPAEKRLLKTPNLPLSSEWTGSLKPTAGNVPAHGEGPDRFAEIQYFRIHLREADYDRSAKKLAQLYHRYLPYPLVLTLHSDTRYRVSTATKHIPATKGSASTNLTEFTSPTASLINADPPQVAFERALAFPNITALHLKTVYESYLRAVVAFNWQHAAGSVVQVTNPYLSQTNLEERRRLKKEENQLVQQIRKSKRMPERVELQLKLNVVRKDLAELAER